MGKVKRWARGLVGLPDSTAEDQQSHARGFARWAGSPSRSLLLTPDGLPALTAAEAAGEGGGGGVTAPAYHP